MARDEQQRREMGQRIKEMRAARNLKQQVIADEVGVSLRQYQNWQAGENTPEPDHLERLADVLKVTPEWLLRGDTPDPFSAAQGDLAGQLAQIAEQVNELHDFLLGDGQDAEVVAGVAARLLRAAGLPQQPTGSLRATPSAARQRGRA